MIEEPTCLGLGDEFRDTARSRGQQNRKETPVSATVLDMSMSLDGFIAGPNEGPGNGLGDGGQRLHEWALTAPTPTRWTSFGLASTARSSTSSCPPGRSSPAAGPSSPLAAGAATITTACRSSSSTASEPGIDIAQWPLVTYVNDIETAMAEAKEAAGDKNVLVHGAGTAQLALAAGALDELELHVVPVLLGQGRRLFEGLAPEQIELQRTRILEGEVGVTHMHYRVQY